MTANFFRQNEGSSRMEHFKQQILYRYLFGDSSIPELSKVLGLSVPTVTKLLNELRDEEFVVELGKQSVAGGRQPSIYGLNPDAAYFVGVEIRRDKLKMMAVNFKAKMIASEDVEFNPSNDHMNAIDMLCTAIKEFIARLDIPADKIAGIGVCISGRVNSAAGYSYSSLFVEEQPLAELLGERLGYNVYIENDSRAATFGEYISCIVEQEISMLYVNISWGLGLGIIVDGKLVYGKSGFSGEYGHFPMFDNEIICRCGKRGCLETEVSGSAVHRRFVERLSEGRISILSDKYNAGEQITLDDIVDAVLKEDVLAIEIVESMSLKLGKALAGLINIFNPELIVLGGTLSGLQEYLLSPIQSSINKYALRMVSKDTRIKVSKLGDDAVALGGCLLARSRAFDLL